MKLFKKVDIERNNLLPSSFTQFCSSTVRDINHYLEVGQRIWVGKERTAAGKESE